MTPHIPTLRRISVLVPSAAALTLLAGCSGTNAPAPAAPSSTSTPAASVTSESAPVTSEPTPVTTSASASNGSGEVIRLTENVPAGEKDGITVLPHLVVDAAPGWKATIIDKGGLDQWEDPRSGCTITAMNLLDEPAASDAEATERYRAKVAQEFADEATNPKQSSAEPVVIRRGGVGIEFSQDRTDYDHTQTHARWSTRMLLRGFSVDKALLGMNVSCPAETFESDPSLVTKVAERIRVSEGTLTP